MLQCVSCLGQRFENFQILTSEKQAGCNSSHGNYLSEYYCENYFLICCFVQKSLVTKFMDEIFLHVCILVLLSSSLKVN